MATASEVLRIAAGEIGYSLLDRPAAGHEVRAWYAQSHGSYYGASGVLFCAMFVSWVMSRAGQAFPGLPAAYVPYVLSAGRLLARSGTAAVVDHRLHRGQFNWDGVHPDHEGNTNNGA